MQPVIFDIAVIGGGASGLAAAIEAKQHGGEDCRVAVIEKNSRLGKKILSTGNGRCNLGNTDEKESFHYYGSCSDLVNPLFEKFDGSEMFFRSLGLICKEDSGRLYPYSNHAASVLDALRFKVQQTDTEVITDSEVVELHFSGKNWEIITNNEKILSYKVIIACGGKSTPAMGTDGNFYNILRSVGHSWNNLHPALCPVLVDKEQIRGLKGIRASGKAYLCNRKNEIIRYDTGEIQFTENALSGICIFNLSAFINEKDMIIKIDLMHTLTDDQVRELLWSIYMQRYDWKIEDMLTGIFQKKMCISLIRKSNISCDNDSPVYSLTNSDIESLVKTIKSFSFNVKGLSGWNQSQVTAGGIKRSEIKETLESKLCKGLYFSGEILDIAGECGGYNLAWAWCSGVSAARNAVDALKGGGKA